MDGLTAKVYNNVKCYLRTRGYHRLTSTGGHEQQLRRGGRRGWRIRLNRRLKLNLPRSPKKIFVGLRDAYVNMIMKLANASVVGGRTVSGYNGDAFGKINMVKEYDEKIIIEICKSLAVRGDNQHQISTQIACSGRLSDD